MKSKESTTLELMKENIEEKASCFIRIHKKTGSLEDIRADPKLMDHWHKELEINYILGESVVEYCVDGQRITAQSGDIVIINCESVHSITVKKLPDDNNKNAVITLIIDYDFLREVIPDIDESVFTTDQPEYLKPIKETIIKIVQYYESDTTERKNVMIKGLLYEILYHLCDEHIKKSNLTLPDCKKKNLGRLRDILSYIDEHYNEPIRQEDMAGLICFSKAYFARFFKSYTNITFHEYLTKYRLLKAEAELRFSEKSITDIAMDKGFSDTRYFINSFRKYYDITPHQYRLAHRGNNN